MDLIKHLQDGGKVAFRAAPGVALEGFNLDGNWIRGRLARWHLNGQFFASEKQPFDLVPHVPADDGWDDWVERPEGVDTWGEPTKRSHKILCQIEFDERDKITRYRLRKPAQTPEQRLEAAKAAYVANPCEANHHAVMRAQEALTSPTGGVK